MEHTAQSCIYMYMHIHTYSLSLFSFFSFLSFSLSFFFLSLSLSFFLSLTHDPTQQGRQCLHVRWRRQVSWPCATVRPGRPGSSPTRGGSTTTRYVLFTSLSCVLLLLFTCAAHARVCTVHVRRCLRLLLLESTFQLGASWSEVCFPLR